VEGRPRRHALPELLVDHRRNAQHVRVTRGRSVKVRPQVPLQILRHLQQQRSIAAAAAARPNSCQSIHGIHMASAVQCAVSIPEQLHPQQHHTHQQLCASLAPSHTSTAVRFSGPLLTTQQHSCYTHLQDARTANETAPKCTRPTAAAAAAAVAAQQTGRTHASHNPQRCTAHRPHLQQHHTPQNWWLVPAPAQLLRVDLLYNVWFKWLLLLLCTCSL
jgi:hypothetical protein